MTRLLLSISLCLAFVHHVASSGPTEGFVSLPLNRSNFDVQRPYDVPEDERYSFQHGVHKLWVYSSDKPHAPTSHTAPRTEIRIRGYDYSSGVWQFEGHGYVPRGTSGVCIMQVFGASPHATTAALVVYNGTLSYYTSTVLLENIYDRWFKLNVIHHVNASAVEIYIDGQFKMVAPGRGEASHYFKCGVYAQRYPSNCMESRWKEIKILKISD
ncbi:citrate-binding protein-like [Rhodamnia argentea]|uniref:Citrate-binding protein-like n=1 Tax=Rhodamnia argentea TaxID=178133 RepID=A0A8B8PJN9_9MYRT|nr:citrate-binding protein-like [Rhodamnia argentea]